MTHANSPPQNRWDGVEFFTPDEVAGIVRKHRETIREMLRAGEILGARKVGRNWRIPRSWVFPPTTEKPTGD